MGRSGNVFVLILVGVAVALFFWLRNGSISAAEAKRLVGEGARLVDVRSPEEYAEGHLPGALNVSVQELPGRMDELGPKEGTVVLYCRSGARSRRAARMLKEAGFQSVHDLGAMGRW